MVEFTGGGDPRRSLELLWNIQTPGRRGPKPKLSVEEIVATAIALADAEGLAALSMRRVAQSLGVSTMSLYTYLPSKSELIDVMLDRVWGEATGCDTIDGDWRARLEFMAREDLALGKRHPWMLQVATHRPPIGPNVAARYERAFSAIDGLGLTEIQMDLVIAVFETYVRGAARFEVEGDEIARRTGQTDHQWWLERHELIAERKAAWLTESADAEVLSGHDFPVARRVGAACTAHYASQPQSVPTFEFGLQRMLDGVGVFIASCAASQP